MVSILAHLSPADAQEGTDTNPSGAPALHDSLLAKTIGIGKVAAQTLGLVGEGPKKSMRRFLEESMSRCVCVYVCARAHCEVCATRKAFT